VAVAVLSNKNPTGQLQYTSSYRINHVIDILEKNKQIVDISTKQMVDISEKRTDRNRTFLINPYPINTKAPAQQSAHEGFLQLAKQGGFTPQSLWDFWKYMQTLSDTEVTEKCVAIGEWGVKGLAKALEGLQDKKYLQTIDRPYWQPEPSTPHYHVVGHLRER
jgi:hypothetical protein